MKNEKNKELNFKVINPNTIRELPKFSVNRNRKWINYGEDNLYPQYLLDVFHNRSNKHKAIINRKVDMTVGSGIEEPKTTELKTFLKNSWSDKTVEEIAYKIDFDYEIMNGFALKVKWNLTGDKIAAIDYMPFHKCRLSPDEETILVSKDWENPRRSENVPIPYKRFDPEQAKENPIQIYYYVEETNGIDYYPLPYYSSTLNWIELDWEISNFHLNSVRNGFMPGFILNFATGVPTDEEMDKAYTEFQKKYTGSQNAGKFILTFSEGTEQEPKLEPINLNDSDERFILIHKEMMNEILIGHSVTSPLLFGIKTEGQLGGRTELLEALAIFQSTYISGKQRIIERELNKIIEYAGIEDDTIIFKEYDIDFSNVEEKIDEKQND